MTGKPGYEELESRVKLLKKEVAERKRAEKDLKIQKAYFESLLDSAPEAIALADTNQRIIRTNDQFTSMFGYTPEEALGKTCDQLIAGPEKRDEASEISLRVGQGESVRVETMRYRKDGTPVFVELMAAPIRIGKKHIGDYASYRDVSDRKLAEEAIKESERKFRAAFEGSHDAITLTRRDGRLLDCNQRALEIFGVESKEEFAMNAALDHSLLELHSLAFAPESRIMDFALEVILKKTQSEFSFLGMMDENESAMTIHRWSKDAMARCAMDDKPIVYPICKAGLWAGCVRHRKPIVVNDYESSHPGKKGIADGHVPIERFFSVPVFDGERIVAVAAAANKKKDYTDFDLKAATVLLGKMWDLLHRKRAEEALAKSERFYRTVLSSIHEDILVIDRDYRIRDINNSALKTLGVAREKAIGHYCYEISHHLGAPCHEHGEQCPLGRVFETDESVNCHHLHVGTDGTRVYVDILMSPMKDEEGNVTHVVAAARDVTDLFESREELQRSQNLLNDSQEIAKIGGWEYDVIKGKMTWTNEVYRIYGVDKDYDIDDIEKDTSFYSEEDQPIIRQAFASAVAHGRPYDLELRLNAGDGMHKRVRTMGKPVLENGKVVRVVGNIIDMTGRKKAAEERLSLQEQLRQSQKVEAIGQLAGGIAHDFNNALTVILGNAEMVLGDVDKNDPFYGVVEEIKKAGERASRLTRQLLAFSRKQILRPEILNLNEVVSGMERMLGRMILENIELKTELVPDLGLVEADHGQIEQVIINLAVNARDAMPGGGKLTIETKNVELDDIYARKHLAVAPGSYVMLAVSDTGIGITKEVQERIFEPFFTTKEEERGTGLGLSTVYGIVKQSKGNIWVYSEPGKGAAFKIYLPRVERAGVERKDGAGEEIQTPYGSETVLAVEDEELVRKVVSKFLDKFGYTVLVAANGEEALRICREHKGPIHLLLTDVVMPGLSGKELATQLRELRPELKVLFMSGYTDNAIVKHGILEDGIAFVQKPFTHQALVWKVREVLGVEPLVL